MYFSHLEVKIHCLNFYFYDSISVGQMFGTATFFYRVAPGGHAWLLGGCGCSRGACHWLLWGVCMVARGACVVARGVHGCSGSMRGCSGGACVVAGGCVVAWGHMWLLWGVCMVALGGCAWLLGRALVFRGGVRGFFR